MRSMVDERTNELLELRRGKAGTMRRGWLVRRMLLLADVLGLLLAFAIAETLYPHVLGGRSASWLEAAVFVASVPAWIVIAKLYGLYDHDSDRTDHSTAQDVSGVFHTVLVCTCMFWLGARVTGLAKPPAGNLVWFVATAVPLIGLFRAAARTISRRHVAYLQNTLIVGAGWVGQRVAQKLLNHPEYGINLVGFVDDDPKERMEGLGQLIVLGGTDKLVSIVQVLDVERVVIAFSNDSHEKTLTLLRSLKDADVQIDIVPRLFEILGPGVGLHTVEGMPLMGLPPPSLTRSSRLLKRSMDFGFAALALVTLGPFLAVIAALIKLDSTGPAFFRQERMGTGGRTFRIWKFRTMIIDADDRKHEVEHLNMHATPAGDARMFKVPNDPRTTRVGRYLRRYSLDELPQLVNVLTGDMSLVGPRPLILSEDKFVAGWARRRLDLKPGITGPWQVLGRSGIPFREMVNLDYLYVTGWSFWGDLELMIRTVPVFARSAHGEVTASGR
jgi:exopolysaccharide biosynthesis polyprenyl glycosylphosphotransferase